MRISTRQDLLQFRQLQRLFVSGWCKKKLTEIKIFWEFLIIFFFYRAVANFTDVNKQIQAKKSVVEKMNAELDKANKELSFKQEELKKVEDKVGKLEKEYNDNKLEKDRLDKEI